MIKNSQKIAFFANFKAEFIFVNDGNVDNSRELIFANWSILDFPRKIFSRNWPKLAKFAKINSLEVLEVVLQKNNANVWERGLMAQLL